MKDTLAQTLSLWKAEAEEFQPDTDNYLEVIESKNERILLLIQALELQSEALKTAAYVFNDTAEEEYQVLGERMIMAISEVEELLK